MKIWLDDNRPAPEGWVWVKHPDDMLAILVHGREIVEEISFDHDLGIFDSAAGEITGYDALCAIETLVAHNLIYKPKKMHIHSANGGARKKMELAIKSIEKM